MSLKERKPDLKNHASALSPQHSALRVDSVLSPVQLSPWGCVTQSSALSTQSLGLCDSVLSTQHSVLSGPQTQCSPKGLFVNMSVELLRQGSGIRFRAPGSSMHPTIRNEEVIGVEPVNPSEIKRGDIILYQTERSVIAHRVVKIKKAVANQRSAVSIQHSALSTHCSVLSTQSSVLSSEPSVLSFEPSALSVQHSSLSSAPSGSRSSILDPQSSIPSTGLSVLGFKDSSLSPQSSSLYFTLRGDSSDTCDEPVDPSKILGKVVSVERNGHTIDLDNPKSKMLQAARLYTYRFKRAIIKYIRTNGIIEKWNHGTVRTGIMG